MLGERKQKRRKRSREEMLRIIERVEATSMSATAREMGVSFTFLKDIVEREKESPTPADNKPRRQYNSVEKVKMEE